MAETLKERINTDVKQAMRDKEKQRLAALRMITAAIKQKEVDERTELDDNGVLALIDKLAKQYRDSIEQYREAGRDDLVEKETNELNIISEYLPEQLNETELEALIKKAIEEAGAEGMQDMGKVMGILKPKVQGRTDMGEVSAKVKTLLS